MKIINLAQGSQEWHIYRQNHMGGSDAPAIMGLSPYKTRYELWIEKVGLSDGQIQNSAMVRGNMLEEEVRNKVNYILKGRFTPAVFESKNNKSISCSVDGYDSDLNRVIEIKCGSKSEHEGIKLGIVPDKYMPQLQQILYVTDIKEIIYCSYHNDDIQMTTVKRDDDFIKDMVKQEIEFWKCVEDLEEPEITEFHKRHSKPQYESQDSQEWKSLAKKWRKLQIKKANISYEEDELKKKIIDVSGEKNSEGDGIKLLKVEKKGSIQYKSIPEIREIDLELYRSPAVTYWRIDAERKKIG